MEAFASEFVACWSEIDVPSNSTALPHLPDRTNVQAGGERKATHYRLSVTKTPAERPEQDGEGPPRGSGKEKDQPGRKSRIRR